MPTFNTTDPKPGYVYNSSDDTWYPLLGLATQSLDALTDVVITSPATNQVLVYNGINWVNSGETGDISAITSGTGITVTSGTGPIPSIAIDTTVTVDLNTAQTLTNKTISGTSNTITNLANSSLTNSSITINGSAVSLGGTVTISTDPNPQIFMLMGA